MASPSGSCRSHHGRQGRKAHVACLGPLRKIERRTTHEIPNGGLQSSSKTGDEGIGHRGSFLTPSACAGTACDTPGMSAPHSQDHRAARKPTSTATPHGAPHSQTAGALTATPPRPPVGVPGRSGRHPREACAGRGLPRLLLSCGNITYRNYDTQRASSQLSCRPYGACTSAPCARASWRSPS